MYDMWALRMVSNALKKQNRGLILCTGILKTFNIVQIATYIPCAICGMSRLISPDFGIDFVNPLWGFN